MNSGNYHHILNNIFFSCSKTKNKTIEDGRIGMIGFSSLMSKNSMERIYEDSIYLVHLQSYQRAWNYYVSLDTPSLPEIMRTRYYYALRDNDSILVKKLLPLNIMAAENKKRNCVLFFITPDELAQFDECECYYDRIDVTDNTEQLHLRGDKVYANKAQEGYTYNSQQQNNTVLT